MLALLNTSLFHSRINLIYLYLYLLVSFYHIVCYLCEHIHKYPILVCKLFESRDNVNGNPKNYKLHYKRPIPHRSFWPPLDFCMLLMLLTLSMHRKTSQGSCLSCLNSYCYFYRLECLPLISEHLVKVAVAFTFLGQDQFSFQRLFSLLPAFDATVCSLHPEVQSSFRFCHDTFSFRFSS